MILIPVFIGALIGADIATNGGVGQAIDQGVTDAVETVTNVEFQSPIVINDGE